MTVVVERGALWQAHIASTKIHFVIVFLRAATMTDARVRRRKTCVSDKSRSKLGPRVNGDDVCLYGPTDGCEMTQPGGYCDPDGDADFSDADWVRGYYEHRNTCT